MVAGPLLSWQRQLQSEQQHSQQTEQIPVMAAACVHSDNVGYRTYRF